MHTTNLLPVYSIQTNMVSTVINEQKRNQVLVLLASGKQMLITCPTDYNANSVFNSLHFYSVFKIRENNSVEKDFYFTIELV